MYSWAFIATLMASSSVLALPRGSGGFAPANTHITYYQGGVSSINSSNICNIPVSSGILFNSTCHQLHTSGISIGQYPTADCRYTLYPGSADCGHQGTVSISKEGGGVRQNTIEIPKGNGTQCIETGVRRDGGDGEVVVSGKWVCEGDGRVA